jgi:hypothetical protein
MLQLILHLIGDYVTQSDWMAQNKTKRSWPALCHAVVYSLPFLLVTQSPVALTVICGTHFLIDRFRLARYVVYAKNIVFSPHRPCDREYIDKWRWSNCSATGYPSDAPPWLAVWLLIAADNTLHLAINYAAIRWL